MPFFGEGWAPFFFGGFGGSYKGSQKNVKEPKVFFLVCGWALQGKPTEL